MTPPSRVLKVNSQKHPEFKLVPFLEFPSKPVFYTCNPIGLNSEKLRLRPELGRAITVHIANHGCFSLPSAKGSRDEGCNTLPSTKST